MVSHSAAFFLAAAFATVYGLPADSTLVSAPATMGGAYTASSAAVTAPQPAQQLNLAAGASYGHPNVGYGPGHDVDDWMDRRGRSRSVRRWNDSDCSEDSRSGHRRTSSASSARSSDSDSSNSSDSDSDSSSHRSRSCSTRRSRSVSSARSRSRSRSSVRSGRSSHGSESDSCDSERSLSHRHGRRHGRGRRIHRDFHHGHWDHDMDHWGHHSGHWDHTHRRWGYGHPRFWGSVDSWNVQYPPQSIRDEDCDDNGLHSGVDRWSDMLTVDEAGYNADDHGADDYADMSMNGGYGGRGANHGRAHGTDHSANGRGYGDRGVNNYGGPGRRSGADHYANGRGNGYGQGRGRDYGQGRHMTQNRDNRYAFNDYRANTSGHSKDIADRRQGRFQSDERHADETSLDVSGRDRSMVDRFGQRATSHQQSVDAARREADSRRVNISGPNGSLRSLQRSGEEDTFSRDDHSRSFVGPNRRAFENSFSTSTSNRQFSQQQTEINGRPNFNQ